MVGKTLLGRLALFGTLCLGGIASAQAQSISSFNIVGQFSDVTILTSDNLTYSVAVGANPTFTYNSTVYQITDVIGFWVLSDTVDFAAVNSDFTSSAGNWKENKSNSGTGAIAGWKASNTNAGLTPGESETFTFASLSPSSAISDYGLHVRVVGTFPNTGGNTGHIRFDPVPEPASLAVLALGVGSLFRMRRRK